MKNDYSSCQFLEASRQDLQNAGLDSFHTIWKLNVPWFEPVNKRRNGWSGVITWPEKEARWFIKRQENHNTRTWSHPFRGVPTFRKEFENFTAFSQAMIPTLYPVFYGERKEKSSHQAIIITEALTGYQDLYAWYESNCENTPLILSTMEKLATLVRHMHDQGFIHRCLYPNHVLLKQNGEKNIDIRLIDLEKAKKCRVSAKKRIKDLDCFFRHANKRIRESHLEHFLLAYLDKPLLREKAIRRALSF